MTDPAGSNSRQPTMRQLRGAVLALAGLTAAAGAAMVLIATHAGGAPVDQSTAVRVGQPGKVTVFMLIPKKYWVNTNLPQTVITDTLVRGMYCLDYNKTDPNGPGVVLLSYTWEDDALKQLAMEDLEGRVQRLVEDVRITAPEIADYLHPVNFDFEENVRVMDWDRPQFYPVREVTPGYYGAFKLNFPGDDHYSQALFFQFQQACAPGGKRIYLCGDSISFTGGWIEGAIQSALNAVCGVIRASGGTFETLRNPVDDMDASAYSYATTVPADE